MGFIKKAFDFIRHPTNSRTVGLLILLILVSAVSLTVIVGQQQQTVRQRAAAPTDGLVGYWNFDEGSGSTAADSSGNHDGTLYNGPTWVSGIVDNKTALSFNGTNQYVIFPLITQATTNFSISAWVKWDGTNLPNKKMIFQNGLPVNGSNGNGYGLYASNGFCGPGNYLTIDVPFRGCDVTSSTYALIADRWTHVIITRGDTTWKLYVDGTQISNPASPANAVPITPTTQTTIGGFTNTGSGFSGFAGAIDDVRIYNRELTPQEVIDFDNSGIPTPTPTPTTPPRATPTPTPFPKLPPPCIPYGNKYGYGDVNLDGGVSLIDAVYVERHIVKAITLTDQQKLSADVNGDGNVNSADALLIKRYLVEAISTFPVCPTTTVTIHGQNVDVNGDTLTTDIGQKITLSDGSRRFGSEYPGTWYFYQLIPGTTYTVTSTILPSFPQVYTISYSLCVNCTDHTVAGGHPYVPYASGDLISVPLPTGGNYADIYFKYTPIVATPTPTPTSTPTPTPTPTSTPSPTPTPAPKLTPPCGQYGDVNLDGYVSLIDATNVERHIVRTITLTGDAFRNADVNGDGSVDSADALLIKRYLVESITTFPVCSITPTPTLSPTPTPTNSPTPTPTPIACALKSRGDAAGGVDGKCDGHINILDFNRWRDEFKKILATSTADFDGKDGINIVDFNIWKDGFKDPSLLH